MEILEVVQGKALGLTTLECESCSISLDNCCSIFNFSWVFFFTFEDFIFNLRLLIFLFNFLYFSFSDFIIFVETEIPFNNFFVSLAFKPIVSILPDPNIIFLFVGLFLLLFKHSCPKVRSVMGCTYKQPRTDLNLEHKWLVIYLIEFAGYRTHH